MDEVTDIYQEYLQGQDFKRRMQPKSQYRLSDECSAFYNGDQWRGLAGSDKNPTPVINIEKLIINRKIAEIRPFEVSARYRIDSLPLEHPAVPYMATVQDTLNGITQAKWNILNMTTFALESCLNAAINGMAVAHTFWDTEFEAFAADAAEKIKGDFRTELIPPVNVYFGNPNSQEVQTQPYIIIAMRKTIKEIKKLAKQYGRNNQTLKNILPDSDVEAQPGDNKNVQLNGEKENDQATLLYRFEKKNGVIYASCVTRNVEIYRDRKLKLTKYPIAVFLWGRMDSCAYGLPECYDIHKNQIAINRAMGSAVKNLLLTGSPKLIYDNTRIRKFNNEIGGTQPVNGEVSNAARFLDPPRMGAESIQIIGYLVKMTLESKGMNDVMLGSQASDSAKALSLAQAQATQPLKLEQERFYKYIRDICEIWLDYIVNYYDVERVVRIPNSKGEEQLVSISGNLFKELPISVSIDVGKGGEWNEMAMTESILEMITAGHLDVLSGFEMLPSKYFSNKEKILEVLRRNQAMMMQMQQQQGGGQGLESVMPEQAIAPANNSSIPELLNDVKAV